MNQTVTIQTHDEVVQVKGNIVSDMDGEKVMLSIQNGKYYNLGKVGGDIWERIASPKTVSALTDELCSEYDIDRDVCERQVLAFLEQLAKEHLVEVGRK